MILYRMRLTMDPLMRHHSNQHACAMRICGINRCNRYALTLRRSPLVLTGWLLLDTPPARAAASLASNFCAWRSPPEASVTVCALLSVTSLSAAAAALTTALATDALECAGGGALGDFAGAAADWVLGAAVLCTFEEIAAVDIDAPCGHFAGQSPRCPGIGHLTSNMR